MLGAEHPALVVAEERADGRVVLVKTAFDRGQEGVRRRLGQQPEVARKRPPPPLIGVLNQSAHNGVGSPAGVRNCADPIAPQGEQNENLANAVAQQARVVRVNAVNGRHPALIGVHVEARVRRSKDGVRGGLEPLDVGARQAMREQEPGIEGRRDAPGRANLLQRAVELPNVGRQGGNDCFVGLIGDLRQSSPIGFGVFVPASGEERRKQSVWRRLLRPFRKPPGGARDQAAQNGEVAGAVAGERLGARLGDAGCHESAGDPFAGRSGKRTHFAARDGALIVDLQDVVAALREASGQAGFGLRQQEDQGRWRIGEGAGRCSGGRDEAAGTVGGRQIARQLAEGSLEERCHLIRAGRLKRQNGRLTAKPA